MSRNPWVHIPLSQLKNHTMRKLASLLEPTWEAYAYEIPFEPTRRQRELGCIPTRVQIELLYNGVVGYLARSDQISGVCNMKGHTLDMLQVDI